MYQACHRAFAVKVWTPDKATFNCQGKNCQEVEALLKGGAGTSGPPPVSPIVISNTEVIVVYGHDAAARDQFGGNASEVGV